MNSKVFITSLALILMQLVVSTSAETTDNKGLFSRKIFNVVSGEKKHENVIISPASIQTALALVYMGAEGTTADNLKHVLNLGDDSVTKEQIAQQFGNQMSKLREAKTARATLKMANRIYVKEGYQIHPQFDVVAKRYFDSAAEAVNFTDNVNTAEKINNWIEQQTEKKIQNAVSSDDLHVDTTAILVNAIYFKAKWSHPFNERITTKRDFHLSKTKTKEVDMMFRGYSYCGYFDFPYLDARGLSMSYIGTNIKMFVVLPNQIDGLDRMENRLRKYDLTKLLATLEQKTVSVFFPKFKIESDMSLVRTLKVLGMIDLFSPKANLSSLLTTNDDIFVSKVQHKAIIEVDEEGTIAAGITAVGVGVKSMPPMPDYEFNVNRPFFFALLDEETVYFAGHVVDI